MNFRLKRYPIAIVLYFIIFLWRLPGNQVKDMELRLDVSKGPERLEILAGLSKHYSDIAPKKALQYGRQGLELLNRLSPGERRLYQVPLLNSLSTAAIKLGDYEKAGEYARQGLEMARERGNKTGQADAMYNLGEIKWLQGVYPEAADFFNKAQQIYKELNHSSGMGYTHNYIGLIHWKLGDLTKALERIMVAEKFYDKAGDKKGLARAYNHTGIMYWELDKLENALFYYNKAGKLFEELGDKAGLAKTLGNIAMVYDKQGKHSDAWGNFNRSIQLKQEVDDKRGIAKTLYFMAKHLEDRNELHRALDYFSRAGNIMQSINDAEALSGNLINMGRVKRKLGKYLQAVQHVEQGLAIAEKIDAKERIRNANIELSEICIALNDFPRAMEYYKKYKEVNDSIVNETSIKKMVELQTRYEVDRKEKEIVLLKKDKLLRDMDLARQKNLVFWLLVVSFLILILAFVLFARYRLKTRVMKELKEEIEHRKKAESELLRAQKLESVGILAGGIAHDFNNLLTIIIGNLDMALEGMDVDTQTTRMLKAAEKSSLQAAELAGKLITFSKGGWINPQELSLTEVLNTTMEHYPELEALELTIKIPSGLSPLYGDERQLRQVMHNLLQNALDAVGDSNAVTVEAENIKLDRTNDFTLNPGPYVKISVTDNGEGIAPEHLGKIFDPYFSTRNSVNRKGMGLGLAICYSIIGKHKGHIAVSSEPGKGTVVTIYLPAFTGE
jgi:signal transduction histidine kinase/Flp pilus assembly protein TadD